MQISNELEEELRAIIREELYSIIFEKREFEKSITTYMKSLIYDELLLIKRKDNKIDSFDTIEYHISNTELRSVNFTVTGDEKLKEAYKLCVSNNKIDCTYDVFERVLKHKSSEDFINWIEIIPRSKAINQRSIFDLLYSLNDEIINLEGLKKQRLINFVCKSFLKNGASLELSNIDNTFSKWKSKKIEQIDK